jgi:carbonic anhydrase/acetyltransferase-like protein (isoleucine patch superfamily)
MVAVSAVLHSARMQPDSVAAAGAVLVGEIEVPSGHRAQGVPARIVEIPRHAPESIEVSAGRYVEMAARHIASSHAQP